MAAKTRKWPTPEDLEKAVKAYFAAAKKDKTPVSKVGLAVALGISRMGLWKYQERKGYDEVLNFADAQIEQYLVNRVLTGEAKTIGGPIFILKTCHGYHETQKLEHDGVLEIRVKKFAADASDPAK